MNLVKVISTSVDSAMRRIVKVLRMGKSDVQTPFDVSSYGIDSHPIKDMIAIYDITSSGETVVVGYINKNKKAELGELRLFSTDANGSEKFFVWLKNNGTLQLGGTVDNIVRYIPLDAGLQKEAVLINNELAKIAAALNALIPGIYTHTPISVDISQSKINEIKTL